MLRNGSGHFFELWVILDKCLNENIAIIKIINNDLYSRLESYFHIGDRFYFSTALRLLLELFHQLFDFNTNLAIIQIESLNRTLLQLAIKHA